MKRDVFSSADAPFFKDLRVSVNIYLSASNLRMEGDRKLVFKGLLQVLSAICIYTWLVFYTPPPWLSIGLCVTLGLNMAVIGFNVMHEGGHGCFSTQAWLNKVSAYSLNALGGCIYFWKKKHNINHHTYTNVEGIDSDIDVKPFMRLHEGQPLRPYHRYQYIYWVVLYAISYLVWVFYNDFQKYFSKRLVEGHRIEKIPLREHVIFWTTKVMYVFVYMIVPIVMVGWVPWLIGFSVVTVVCGFTTSIVFQLAHVVEGTQFHFTELPDKKDRQEWAVHQVCSTANFATDSKVLHWLLGGLNFQIEHHLFPRISHIHYPAISRTVKEACREHNLIYREYSSMFKAINSHLKHLRKLGMA